MGQYNLKLACTHPGHPRKENFVVGSLSSHASLKSACSLSVCIPLLLSLQHYCCLPSHFTTGDIANKNIVKIKFSLVLTNVTQWNYNENVLFLEKFLKYQMKTQWYNNEFFMVLWICNEKISLHFHNDNSLHVHSIKDYHLLSFHWCFIYLCKSKTFSL